MIFDSQENAPDAITNPVQIRSLLKKLVERCTILSVTVENYRRHGTSALLSLDNPTGYLVMDELVPKRVHEQIKAGSRLAIHTRLDNVDLRFVLQIASIGNEGGIALYRARIPTWVRYSQRRRAFRSRIGAGKPMQVKLHRPDSSLGFDGELVDLSVTGFGARVSQHEPLAPGDEVVLVLPVNEDSFHEIRGACTFSTIEEQSRQRRIGGRFLEMDQERLRYVTNLVSSLQREQLRRLREL